MALEQWRPTALGAEVDLLTGFPFRSVSYVESLDGIRLLRGDNIAQGSLRWEGVKRWPQVQAADFVEFRLQKDDVVLAMDRPWIDAGLKHAAVRDQDMPCLLVQRVARLRGKSTLSTKFLRYLIGSPSFTSYVQSVQTGTAVPHISGNQIKEFRFLRPPINEQHGIASILGALDDKIELNHRMNQTLEAMARAIFKSWFLDFEPARVGRAEYRTSLERASAGQIPEGWALGKLGDVAVNLRRTLSSPSIQPETPYIGLEHMPRKNIALSDWDLAKGVESSKFAFKAKEVLFGKLRPYFHKVGIAAVDGVCSTDILVISPNSHSYWGLVLFLVSSDDFVQYTDRASAGTKMPRTNWNDMARYELAVPPEDTALAFTEVAEPMVDKINANVLESRSLATLRDTLLPKLLSGEIRVKQAEEIVAEVV